MRVKRPNVLPGFKLTLGITLSAVGLVVLLPVAMLLARSASLGLGDLARAAMTARALAAYKLTFGTAFIAASFNAVLGLLAAWVLARYEFPLRRLLDAIVDLPFALPTAVAGLALTTLYAEHGWLGAPLARLGVKVAFAPLGIVVALVFVGVPFVIRTLHPVIEGLDRDVEEAAENLGATRLQTFWRVILPALVPAWLTGFALAFGRAVGEYGSVVFIAGNMPMKTEIAPLLIVTRLEQFDYAGATAIASVMMIVSLVMLFAINTLQSWTARIGAER